MLKQLTAKPYFSFNGHRSDEMGVLMVNMPTRQHPNLNGSKTTIPGKDGFVYITDGTYAPITVKQDIVIPNNDDLPAVLNWLRGSGDLIFFDFPNRCYPDAVIMTAAQKTSVAKRLEGTKMSITWTCQPFTLDTAYDTSSVVVTKTSSYVNPNGHVDASPLIVVRGMFTDAAQFAVNGTTMQVKLKTNVPLYIDCDAKLAYTLDTNSKPIFAGTDLKLLSGSWITLSATERSLVTFQSPITDIAIYPRWRWL